MKNEQIFELTYDECRDKGLTDESGNDPGELPVEVLYFVALACTNRLRLRIVKTFPKAKYQLIPRYYIFDLAKYLAITTPYDSTQAKRRSVMYLMTTIQFRLRELIYPFFGKYKKNEFDDAVMLCSHQLYESDTKKEIPLRIKRRHEENMFLQDDLTQRLHELLRSTSYLRAEELTDSLFRVGFNLQAAGKELNLTREAVRQAVNRMIREVTPKLRQEFDELIEGKPYLPSFQTGKFDFNAQKLFKERRARIARIVYNAQKPLTISELLPGKDHGREKEALKSLLDCGFVLDDARIKGKTYTVKGYYWNKDRFIQDV